MTVGRDPKSLGETARSISKARMSVKSSALVLTHRQKRIKNTMLMKLDEYAHSTIENRKPIQDRGPPMNVNRFAQTPGIDETASGIFCQRSGLGEKMLDIQLLRTKLRTEPT